MKQFKIKHSGTEYHVFAEDALSAVAKLKDASTDPTETYRECSIGELIELCELQPKSEQITSAEMEYINNGAEINKRFREGLSTKEDLNLIKTLQKGMAPIPVGIKIFRTNTVETIKNNKGLELNPILSCTPNNSEIIPENIGEVKEKLEILVDKDTRLRVMSNPYEDEVILNGQDIDYKVIKQKEVDGIKYKTLWVRNKR